MTIDQMREKFEARFPVPSCSEWGDGSYEWRTSEEYDVFDAINRNHQQNIMFEVWQAAMQQAVPEGWQIVPKEPTADMMVAGQGCYYHTPDNHWKHMLAAAPEVK